jgi:hypothetical protein
MEDCGRCWNVEVVCSAMPVGTKMVLVKGLPSLTHCKSFEQCCRSGSRIGCFFDPWIRDEKKNPDSE